MTDDELVTLRIALRALGRPYDESAVRRLRQRIRAKERRHHVVILTGSPLQISLWALKKHAPDLFYGAAESAELRVLNRLTDAMRKRRSGD